MPRWDAAAVVDWAGAAEEVEVGLGELLGRCKKSGPSSSDSGIGTCDLGIGT